MAGVDVTPSVAVMEMTHSFGSLIHSHQHLVVGDAIGGSFDLDANQGAPPPGAPSKIALVVGAPPAKQPSGP